MRHTCFYAILLAAVALTAVPDVTLAKSPFSASKGGGPSFTKKFSAPKISNRISMPAGKSLSTFGGNSNPGRTPAISTLGKRWSNLGGSKVINNPGFRKPTISNSVKPNFGQKTLPNLGRIQKPAIDLGKIQRLNPMKSGSANPAPNVGRLGNLSNLKNLDIKDLGRVKQLGWIQGRGTVEGLKDLASKIHNGKMADGTLKKIDKGQLGHILKLGQASMSSAEKSAAILAAKKYCGLTTPCHWWFDVICGHHWHHDGCRWDYWCYPVYWKCWTPCHWQVVYCPATPVHESVAYYFGVEGVIIPDTAAFGVQEVKPGSPAERYGVQPGMMIVAVNGRAMTDETVMVDAIQSSGGRLDLEVLVQGSDQPQLLTVILDVVRRSSF